MNSRLDKLPWVREHIELYRSDPMKAHVFTPAGNPKPSPALLLTTKGRKSGELRTIPLIYGGYGNSYVIMASRGGAPIHPIWYTNLEADPNAHIQVGMNHFDVVARVATGPERKTLFDMMVGVMPNYADYEAKTQGIRQIPVVVLAPLWTLT